MNRISRVVAASLVAAAAPAGAAPADFGTCDGYGAPGKKTDGIVKGGWLFGLCRRAK